MGRIARGVTHTNEDSMTNHLVRRGGRYSIRRKIPADLKTAYGRVEIVRALGTSDPTEARRLCRIESVRLDEEFDAKRAAIKSPPSVETPEHRRAREEYEQSEQEYRDSLNIEQEDAENAAYWAAREERIAEMQEAYRRETYGPATPPAQPVAPNPPRPPPRKAYAPLSKSGRQNVSRKRKRSALPTRSPSVSMNTSAACRLARSHAATS
jgi:hypothetical protein